MTIAVVTIPGMDSSNRGTCYVVLVAVNRITVPWNADLTRTLLATSRSSWPS